MNTHRIRIALASLPFLAAVLVGCHGSSPTESDSPSAFTPSKALVSDAAKHGGGDDNGGGTEPGDDNGGGAEPGDDNGGATEPGDDHGHDQGPGGDIDDPAPTPTPTPGPDDHGRHHGRQGARGTVEIEGRVTAVDASSLTIAGSVVAVDAKTAFNRKGDLTSLAQAADAVAAHRRVRAEARATRQADGTLLAQTIKVEVD